MIVHHHNQLITKFKIWVLIFINISVIYASNKAPIILMHGFMGWGRDEMNDFYYWGGSIDLEEYLRSQGYDVYSVSMGPISSNWDRAIEAFYQIKGGQVNYGEFHSETYGIIQKPKGKSYDGFYKEWSEENPIHIISHSQGGQTARMLEYLLKENFHGENSELLAKGKRGWIKSISTISCPHNGTILADIITENLPFLQKMTPLFGAMGNSKIEEFYNFDLDQWNFKRKLDESVSEYLERVSNSRIKNSKNFSGWDLSIKGAEEFNDLYTTDSDTYYYSYPNYSTKELKNGTHFPDWEMSLMVWIPSIIIGTSDKLSPDWYMNDGIVSTVSMKYPVNSRNISEPNKLYNESSVDRGIWQVMEPIHQDHHAIIGHKLGNLDVDNMKLFFSDICKQLYALD
jgi:triacylglycerol lipase